ncbi:MAG: DUF255 domain-containing protein [Phycisphaerales bacterium]|nr:DUF255 domain-containing protein [Phycisphaerales bacterium]
MTSESSNPPRFTNRLARESSPYLLQHAHNPVDWFPWGEEAFAEARRRDVPIFLSVGYSTCYWCHVMERECFESEDIARVLNDNFVCIKVDREQRPDIDEVYMTALQAISGRGGWPMNVALEPEQLLPFWAGTYLPPEPRPGMPSLPQMVEGLSNAWKNRRDEVLAHAREIATAVRAHLGEVKPPVRLTARPIEQAVEALLRLYDRTNGGFGGPPKFPQPVFLEFLLDARERADNATRAAIDIAVRGTLDAMSIGGIHDHINGGFHRYAVDATWTVPHFEKMLYDNAQLLSVYSRSASAYEDRWYRSVVARTWHWLFEFMQSVPGVLPGVSEECDLFAASVDAERDGIEGRGYVWTRDSFLQQINEWVENPHRAREMCDQAMTIFGLDRPPNFKDPHHPEEPPVYVLRMAHRPEAIAIQLGLTAEDFLIRLRDIRTALWRDPHDSGHLPRRDETVIACWNGLMCSALAPIERDVCYNVVRELRESVLTRGGDVVRSYKAGVRSRRGALEDYAAVAAGIVKCALAFARSEDKKEVVEGLAKEGDHFILRALKLFSDVDGGPLFAADPSRPDPFAEEPSRPDLFVVPRALTDGAIPSAQGMLLMAMLDLAELYKQAEDDESRETAAWLRRQVVRLLRVSSGHLAEQPVTMTTHLRVLMRVLADPELAAQLNEGLDENSSDGRSNGPTVQSNDAMKGGSRTAGDAHAPEGARENTHQSPGFTPVEIYAGVDRVAIARDDPAELTLVVRIAPGYHVIAADPGDSEIARNLAPFRVGIIGGGGVVAYADYPAGAAQQNEAIASDLRDIRIYEREFELRVALAREGPWSGRPLLSVTFQACTDTECLARTTVELDVALDLE